MNPAVPIDLQTGSQRLLRADEPPCYGLSVGGHDFPDGRAVALPRNTVDAVTAVTSLRGKVTVCGVTEIRSKSLLRFGDATRSFVDATRFATPKNASVAKPINKVAMIPITKVLSITS
jgi:hypothetical protein